MHNRPPSLFDLPTSMRGQWVENDNVYPAQSQRLNGHVVGGGIGGITPYLNDETVRNVSQDSQMNLLNARNSPRCLPLSIPGEDVSISLSPPYTSPTSEYAPPEVSVLRALVNIPVDMQYGAQSPDLRPTSISSVSPRNRQMSWDYVDAPPPYTPTQPQSALSSLSPATPSLSSGSTSAIDTPWSQYSTFPSPSPARNRSASSGDMLNQVSSRPDHSRPSHRKRSASSASVAKQAAVTGHVHPRASRQLPAPPSRLVLASSTELRETESLLGLAGSGSTQQETDIVLFGRVRKAIAVLSEYIHTVGPTEQLNYGKVNERVTAVVEEVKVLLCVNAMPVEDAWYDTIPDDIRRTCTPRYVAERVRSSYWKVIGTLSSLVTTTIAVQHDPAHSVVDSRLEMTLPDLENTIKEFIKEVQHMKQDASHSSSRRFAKSYRGKFLTSEAGFRSPGAGSAGGWKGLGYVQNPGQSLRALDASVIAELNVLVGPIERKFLGLMASSSVHSKTDRLHSEGREIASQLAQLLQFLGGLDVTRLQNEVDGDIAERHHLIRTLEAAMQALYDDSAVFLSTLQTSGSLEALGRSSSRSDPMGALVTAIMANLSLTISTLKTLLSSHEQDAANSPRSQAAASPRPSTVFVSEATLVPDLGTSPNRSNDDAQGGDIVDMEQALYMRPSVKINTIRGPRRPVTTRSSLHVPAVPSRSSLADERASSPFRSGTPTRGQHLRSPSTGSVNSDSSWTPISAEQSPVSQTETGPNKSPHRATKLFQILGRDAPRHYIDNMNTDSKPWYLRPTYVQSEIRIEPSGEVTAGTRAALVERLTAHDHGDPVFTKDFLMTFKSFMTVNELFDMLVERFWIESPDGLNDGELKEWTSLKQHVIRTRVLNNLKSMIVDDDILESSDMHILKAMHDFISTPAVLEAKAAKQILPMIELRQRGSKAKVKVPYTPMTAPPTPLIPKSRDFKLLDIEPLELARQLTLIEFALYKKIRPSECLRRVREPNADKSSDSIAAVIRLNTKLVNFVVESILSKPDAKKRAQVIKHFISVADRCRGLQNYSSMFAMVSALNKPEIRRLSRTWDLVSQRTRAYFHTCEAMLDPGSNWSNYTSALKQITPPCVPFFGRYLSTLTFINDGAKDNLSKGQMINFGKRQRAADVIRDIKKWQSRSYNFQTVAMILGFVEESLKKYADGVDYGDQWWHLSLEREPRERDDGERITRILQQSGL